MLSLIIICISGFAVGMVLGLQGYHTLSRFGASTLSEPWWDYLSSANWGRSWPLCWSSGGAGSAVAAEIASMVATEQLDGLRMLSINPIDLWPPPKPWRCWW